MNIDAFAAKAKNWDENPRAVEMATRFVAELTRHASPARLLEFGCGTGLVGLQLVDELQELHMLDNSPAMLERLRQKAHGLDKITIWQGEIEEFELPKVDTICSLMALHHVADIERLLHLFNDLLPSGGKIIIGDILKEDGSFHGSTPVPHNGFDGQQLRHIFSSAGFRVEQFYSHQTISKIGADGIERSYPLFILVAAKS